MKIFYLTPAAILLLTGNLAFPQTAVTIDLHKAVQNKTIKVYNRELTLIHEVDHPGISLSKDYGEGIAWINGIEFSNGVIELDVRGEDIKQHSFVGIAFHGLNDSTFDCIYLRPFHFNAPDEESKKKMIQYVSLPLYTWRLLREKSPGKFENSVEPAPKPDSWVRVKVVINGSVISTYINGNKEPSLVIKKVNSLINGAIGFYVADTSGGDFANLTITKNR